MTIFDDNKLYFTDDPELRKIAARDTLAQWRMRGFGPAWLKLGRRVAYYGADLNAWAESRRKVGSLGGA